jgi:hypothetical protein
MTVRGSLTYGERHGFGLSREDLVISIHQFDQYLVRPGRHARQVDRIDVARVRPQPRQVVHVYMQMPDPATGPGPLDSGDVVFRV